MNNKINDGGPAFPVGQFIDKNNKEGFVDADQNVIRWVTNGGLTLRDWFAGQALAGLLADITTGADRKEIETDWDGFRHSIAKYAYEYADAMLSVRGGAQ